MQVWCDIYGSVSRPNWLAWRIVIITTTDAFTAIQYPVEGRGERNVGGAPGTVVKDSRTGAYWVSETPYLSYEQVGFSRNIEFKVIERPPTIEIIGGGGVYKHVIYANGNRIAEKPFYSSWVPGRYSVPPVRLAQLPKLFKYWLLAKNKALIFT